MALAAALAVIFGAAPAWPQGVTTPGLPLVPLGYCQLSATQLASAVGLASCSGGIPARATLVAVQAETANVRWRDDGTAPTPMLDVAFYR